MMLPQDMRLWVGKDHLVWFVIDVIEGLDLAALRSLGKPGKGRPGYDPVMQAVLLAHAYLQAERSRGRSSSGAGPMQRCRVATGNRVPDHSTICRFRAAAPGPGRVLEDLLARVLFVMAQAGAAGWAWSRRTGRRSGRTRRSTKTTDQGRMRSWPARSWTTRPRRRGRLRVRGSRARRGRRAGGAGLVPLLRRRAAAGAGPGRAHGAAAGGAAPAGRSGSRPGWRSWKRPGPRARTSAGHWRRRTWPQPRTRRCAAGFPPGSRSRSRSCGWNRPWPQTPPPRPRGRRRAAAVPASAGQGAGSARQARPAGSSPPPSRPARTRKAKKPQRRKTEKPEPVRTSPAPAPGLMHCTLRGLVQACNAQAPRTSDGVFLLPRVAPDANDHGQGRPGLAGVAASQQVISSQARHGGQPARSSAQAPSCSIPAASAKTTSNCQPRPAASPPQRLERHRPRHSPACRRDDPRDQMTRDLSTRQGRDLYRRRAPCPKNGFADLRPARRPAPAHHARHSQSPQRSRVAACTAASIHLCCRRTPTA